MYRKAFTRAGGGVLSNEARLTAGALAGGNLSPAFLQLCPAMQTLTHALSHEHGLTATAWHPHLLDADAAWHIYWMRTPHGTSTGCGRRMAHLLDADAAWHIYWMRSPHGTSTGCGRRMAHQLTRRLTSGALQRCQGHAAYLAAGWHHCQSADWAWCMAQASQPASSASPWMSCGREFCVPPAVTSEVIL